jgi:hypothetical protein
MKRCKAFRSSAKGFDLSPHVTPAPGPNALTKGKDSIVGKICPAGPARHGRKFLLIDRQPEDASIFSAALIWHVVCLLAEAEINNCSV